MRLLILYGSQTGYCQETAERIYREAKRYHLEPELLAMDDYDRTRLPTEELVVFACSVTGQGDPPDNMRKFWRFLLRKDIPNDALSQMHFGVFGQGDSSYEKFNTPAKKLHKRLLQLGANPLLARGDGDDQHYLGVDGALDPWLQELWTAVLSKYPLKPGLQVISENVLPQPNFTIQFTTNSDLQVPTLEMHHGSVKENERLTSSQHFQDVRHLEIETTAGYEPGDIFVVYPKNDPEMVQRALDYFGWTEMADLPIQIEAKEVKINPRLLQCKSLRELLTDYLDLFGKPRRYFFWLLSYFCADERHAEKLLELSSTEGQDELYGYAHRVRRTTFEVLQDFSSVKMPLQYLLDLIPPMRPRSFSISSSPSAHPNSIHLTVAIVEYQTRLQEPRKGVCTFWMKGWKAGDKIQFQLQKGTFKPNVSKPAIFIGPGTGIAPMRSMLYSRTGDSMLFFGCRYREHDFLYCQELQDLEAQKKLLLYTAFSRDQDEKVYVQDRIVNNPVLADWILNRDAVIYLSGNAKNMPQQVQEAIVSLLRSHGLSDPKAYVQLMQKNGRYQQETWS